jgi:ketosteroid isomerase-like protein
MSDILTFDKDLNQKVLTGSALAAFEQYYDDAVVMQENNDAPCAGKNANRKREQEFFGSIAEFHGAKVEQSAVQGDVSFAQWSLDVTFKNGYRTTLNQVAVRQWNNGKIVHERFFYNKG